MFIVVMKDGYGAEFFGTGDTIEDAVADAEGRAGEDLLLERVWEAKEIKVQKIIEYKILE